jgi:hypothetical protein
MTREQALRFHKELRGMVGEYPYPIPGVQDRLRKMQFAFDGLHGVTTYFDEKVFNAIHWVGIWCTARKWRQWGADPTRLHCIVTNSLSAMEMVIEQQLPAAVEPQGSR